MSASCLQQNDDEIDLHVKMTCMSNVAQEVLTECYSVDSLLAFVSRGSQS